MARSRRFGRPQSGQEQHLDVVRGQSVDRKPDRDALDAAIHAGAQTAHPEEARPSVGADLLSNNEMASLRQNDMRPLPLNDMPRLDANGRHQTTAGLQTRGNRTELVDYDLDDRNLATRSATYFGRPVKYIFDGVLAQMKPRFVSLILMYLIILLTTFSADGRKATSWES